MIGLRDDTSDALPAPPPPSRAPEIAARLFSTGGLLQNSLKLEHRPQQEKMARAAADAMKADESLLFEAGTGVGKSLAYLLPGIVHAVDQSRQMIVSTHTIALQEQLDQKDLPLCRRVFAANEETKPYAAFKSAVLVGKSNYLCTTRLAHALQEKQELFATAEHDDLRRIAAWADKTTEGLRHELNPQPLPEVWEMVSADSSGCSRKYCDCDKCFYQRARSRLRSAHVIIVNHSLLFAHINAGGAAEKGGSRGVLFPDDFVVLDEAHTVPEVATEHCGLRLSSYGVDRMLKYLFNPKRGRGLLSRHGTPEMQQLTVDTQDAAQQFFAHIDERLLSKQTIVRLREEGFAEPWMDGPLQALHKAMMKKVDKMDDGKDRDELMEQAGKLKSLQSSLRQFLALADSDKLVYWVERMGKRANIVALRSAPLDVAPFIREELLKRQTSVIFTSATLAMGGQIEPFQRRIGAQNVRTAVEHSPFDFANRMRVFTAVDVPLPTPQDARLALDVLIDYIDFCTRRTMGGTLVLFTSYFDMKRVAEAMEPIYDGANRPFYMQGRDYSRTELARKLREAGNGVLFGTDSFWTGIDVPGDALSQIIITRLPFEVPTHPILEARTEWIRERGGNPFNELTLPDALITFRQGVGRLIRTARDRGVVTILDSRITQKAYGRLFMECIPQKNVVRMNRLNRLERFQPFV